MQLLHILLSVSAATKTLFFPGRFGVLQAHSNFTSVGRLKFRLETKSLEWLYAGGVNLILPA